ncbi:MAG TPA: hypothetical protein VF816_09750 [Rhodocyclaceae bacterium]
MQSESASYTVGLDIGIASVGWSLLGEDHIIDLGVRAFDKAETAKEGDSLNLVRRSARLTRRRLRRRACLIVAIRGERGSYNFSNVTVDLGFDCSYPG